MVGLVLLSPACLSLSLLAAPVSSNNKILFNIGGYFNPPVRSAAEPDIHSYMLRRYLHREPSARWHAFKSASGWETRTNQISFEVPNKRINQMISDDEIINFSWISRTKFWVTRGSLALLHRFIPNITLRGQNNIQSQPRIEQPSADVAGTERKKSNRFHSRFPVWTEKVDTSCQERHSQTIWVFSKPMKLWCSFWNSIKATHNVGKFGI